MTIVPVQDVSWLLDQLEDPFTLFPIEGVADTLFEAAEEVASRNVERMDWGLARKYWSVEEEHNHEMMGLLVGSIFVLGQAAITQTISILSELRRHPEVRSVIPEKKADRLIAHATTDTTTKLSKIVIINAVSNYFKHVYEWPQKWTDLTMKGAQAETIAIVLQLGMMPGEMCENLLFAADKLGLSSSNTRALATCIQEWREGWARELYGLLSCQQTSKDGQFARPAERMECR